MSVIYESFHKAQLIIHPAATFSESASSDEFSALFDELDCKVKASLNKYPAST